MSVIQHLRSSTTGHAPSSLNAGELAINEADSDLYYRKSGVVTAKILTEPRRLIARGVVTNVANLTLSINPAVIGVFRLFEMALYETKSATNGATLRFRVGTSGGINSGASDYRFGFQAFGSDWPDESETNGNSENVSSIQCSGPISNTQGLFATLSMSTNDPNYDYNWQIGGLCAYVQDTINRVELNLFSGERNAVIDPTQFQLFFSSGNIASMTYTLIGVL